MKGVPHGRATVKNRALEYFVVFVVIVSIIGVSFIALEKVLAGSRDSQRMGDMAAIRQALELYAIDHGDYPATGWVTSGNDSWQTLAQLLKPYIATLPVDPVNEAGGMVQKDGAYTYAYFSTDAKGTLGGSGDYLLVFRAERPLELDLYQQATTTIASSHATFLLKDLTGVDGVFALRAP